MPQRLCCYFCRGYFGDYDVKRVPRPELRGTHCVDGAEDAATVRLRLYCRTCKGHCVFEVHEGALVTVRFEPKPANGGADNEPPLCPPDEPPH